MRARESMLHVLMAAGLTLAVACSGVETQNEAKADGDPTSSGGEETADEPVWINASYLTCDWDHIASRNSAGISCALRKQNGEFAPLDGVEMLWTILDSFGNEIEPSASKLQGSRFAFVLLAKLIAGASAQLEVKVGGTKKVFKVFFDQVLQGMGEKGTLAGCFAGETSVVDCFRAAGIDLQIGDIFSDSGHGRISKACQKNSDKPDDVLCQLGSDGIAGDLDLARNWYKLGTDLLKPDGSVSSEDLCDASGVKVKSQRGLIQKGVRWQPYFDVGKRPCFEPFIPVEAKDSPFYGKYVVYDPEHGKDGEPYCFFVLLKVDTILGEDLGGFLRLAIIKNPKLFKNAANGDELTLERLEATADYFACRAQ